MMRIARKPHQNFSFQKCFPISVISATIILSMGQPAFAADAAAPAAPQAAPTKTSPPPAATVDATIDTAGNDASDTGSETSVAQVIWVKGVVKATQGSAPPRILQRRSPIYEHDVLTTDESGTGEVAFTDSSVITLRESTELKVDQYEFKKDASGSGGTGREVMSLVKGGFRTITGAIPKANPDNYAVNTPVATIGVRGTDYAAFYSQSDGLSAKIFDGSIFVKNSQGSVELNNAISSVFATIKFNQPPKVITKEPAVFVTQPPITPVTKATINSIGPAGGPHDHGGPHGLHGPHIGLPSGGPGGNGPTTLPGGGSHGSGAPKPVTNFCVGLLKSFTKTINDFFS